MAAKAQDIQQDLILLTVYQQTQDLAAQHPEEIQILIIVQVKGLLPMAVSNLRNLKHHKHRQDRQVTL
jgi:hypothetical protein